MCPASTYTEGVPAAWQRVRLAEIQAEEHKEEEEHRKKEVSGVGGLKAVNIVVQIRTS